MWRMGVRDGSARRRSPASWFNNAAQVQVRDDIDTDNSRLGIQDTWATGQLHYRSQESNHMSTVRRS